MISYKQRHAVWQKELLNRFLLPIFLIGVFVSGLVLLAPTREASALTSSTFNFQGRLLSDTGALVPDGSYSIEFKIYDSAAAGASSAGVCSLDSSTDDCWWIETQSVTVQNGYFSVQLGSSAAFGAGVPWDQELWLTMNVASDGEMTPRFKLTAVPYAFTAGALIDGSGNKKTADDFAQLAPSSVQTINAAIAALRLNQTGTGALLQLQGDGSDVFTVDKSGNTVLGAGITLGNSSSTTAGTLRWNGTSFEGYDGSSWAPLGSSAVMPFVSKTKTVTETQNNVNNPGAALQADDELFFSIGANETWNYRFQLQMGVNATPDVKFSVTAPVGATCANSVTDEENAISVANLGCGTTSGIIAVATGTDVFVVSGSVTNGANAGTVTLNWAQNTANAANTTVIAGSFVEASRSVGGSSADVAFIQNGNTFGGLAVLGTNDAFGMSFETNGVERMQLLSTGEIRMSDDVIANRTATGITGTTTGTGTNTTTLTLTADVFNVNDVILIDNAGQDYYTRITVDGGTGTYTVSPAVTFENSRTVTGYNMQNIGATTSDYVTQSNRFFQGYFVGGVVVGAGSTTISDGSIDSTTTLRLQPGGGDVEVGGGLTVTGVLSGDGSGLINIDGSNVDGSTITALNASNISSGTLADGRLSTNVTLLGNTFNGVNQLVRLDGAGALPALDGAALTNITATNIAGTLPSISGANLTSLNASNISSGTLADGRLSTNVALLSGSQTFTGAKDFSAGLSVSAGNLDVTGDIDASGTITGANIVGNGSGLTNLDAGDIATGTLADARLSANVALLSGSQTFSGAKTFSGGLVLGLSSLTSSATVSRSVSLPDEAGTVCMSNTNTCGFLRLAAGSLQTDASNNDVLAVNKTSATGNLIALQRSGGAVFTVANSGALQIQATGTAALDIRNVGGTSYFSVDTNTGNVRIGPTTADANGVFFVLDTKNTTGDPAIGALNNAQYYNSADGKMRCYEGGFWSDCMSTRVLGETTLGSAGNTITVNLSDGAEYLQCRVDVKSRTASSLVYVRFNGDAGGTSYGWNTYSIVATAVQDAQDASDSELQLSGTTAGTVPFSANLNITNFADTRKTVDWTAGGAEVIGTQMNRYSGGGAWGNTTNAITSVSFIASTGNFAAGSHAWCEGRDIR